MRLIPVAVVLVVALAAPTGAAPAARPLPVDALAKAKPGDWTMLEGERRTGGNVVPDRVVVRIGCPVQRGTTHVVWFEGARDHERSGFAYVADAAAPIDTNLFGDAPEAVLDLRSEPSRCMLDKEVACTKVTYTTKDATTVVTLAAQVRASGIVDLEVTTRAGGVRKLHVVGYGRDTVTEWGGAPPRSGLVDPSYDVYVGGGDLRGVAMRGEGPEPRGGAPVKPVKLTCAEPPDLTPAASLGDGGFGAGGGPQPSHGPAVGRGYGVGGGRDGVKGRSAAIPTVALGQPVVVGELDAAIIRRYMKRNLARLSYCYEKALFANDKLEGTVTASFEIGSTGKVASSVASGVDKAVADCVAAVIQDIEFPRPKGESTVTVKLPFTLKRAGP